MVEKPDPHGGVAFGILEGGVPHLPEGSPVKHDDVAIEGGDDDVVDAVASDIGQRGGRQEALVVVPIYLHSLGHSLIVEVHERDDEEPTRPRVAASPKENLHPFIHQSLACTRPYCS